MKDYKKLLSKTPALMFFALFLLYGYKCITRSSYYNIHNLTSNNIITWIKWVLIAAIGVSFLIAAIGCFTKKTGLQKTGFGLLAFFSFCLIVNTFSKLYFNRPTYMPSFCIFLGRLAYALILLMAIRIPAKSRMLGIIAAGVYIVPYVYFIIDPNALFLFSDALDLLLMGSGAVLFGYIQENEDKVKPQKIHESRVWVCPECRTENKISRMYCLKCGRQRS